MGSAMPEEDASPREPQPARLLLLRHAHVQSHRGDVPITDDGHQQADRAGRWIAKRGDEVATVLFGGTRRTRETAEGITKGLGDSACGIEVVDGFALRNPDLYLGGDRVSVVSTAEAFAVQTRAMAAHDVLETAFFREWLEHPERVGFWVAHPSPPGDNAAMVQQRIEAFARSLADVQAWQGMTVVAVTHSPVLRAVGLQLRGIDPGEPPYVSGYEFTVRPGSVDTTEVTPAIS